MSMEDILKLQICVLKVNIHCDGCEKKVKKILRNIDGVCQTKIDAAEGKVAVSSLVDADTIIKKLNKAGKPASLWGAKPDVVSESQKLELYDGGKGQPKDVGSEGETSDVSGKVPKSESGGGANSGNDVGGGGVDGAKAAKMEMPHQLQQLQHQMQQLQMNGMKIPPQFMGGNKMPPFPTAATTPTTAAAPKYPKSVKFNLPEDRFDDEGSDFDVFEEDEEFEDDGLEENFYPEPKMMMKPMAMDPVRGKKNGGIRGVVIGGKSGGGNEIPVQIKGVANSGGSGKKVVSNKPNQGGAGGQINIGGKNGSGGGEKPLHNGKPNGGATGGGNQLPIQGKMLAGGSMGGGMPPQQAGTMKPPNMVGGAGFPADMGQMGPSRPMGSIPMAHHPHLSGMQPPVGGPVNGMPNAVMPVGGHANGMPNNSMPGMGYYQGGGSGLSSGSEMMMQTVAGAGNPMVQHQQYMAMMQNHHHHHHHQQQMMMNGGHYGHNGGHGGGGYPPMGYGYGRPEVHYPMYPEASYNIFSDENPNSSCSVM